MKKSLYLLIFLVAWNMAGCARVPKPSAVPPPPVTHPATALHGIYVTVGPGQTLYRISKAYGISVEELKKINHIQDPTQLEVGQQLFIPQAAPAVPSVMAFEEPVSMEKMRSIVGSKKFTYEWRTITVHHSGTLKGSAKLFDRDHRRRRMGGLFYHFVIGNGSYTRAGAVEVGWRWKKQVKANRSYDIQICLVGDFNKQKMSPSQFGSLVNLIRVLQEEYDIPTRSIREHGAIKGKHTECPGKHFPFNELIDRLQGS